MALGEVAALVEVPLPTGGTDVRVTGVSLDSRTVQPGDLYAALPGFVAHGGTFAGPAVDAGAVAVLTDARGAELVEGASVPVLVVPDPRAVLGDVAALVYGRAARDLTLVGITGTNGKTTTAYLVEAGLRALGRRRGCSVPWRPGSATPGSSRSARRPRPPTCTRCSR